MSSRRYGVVHDYVRAVAFVEVHLFVNDGERDFALHAQAVSGEFPAEVFLVDGLQQTWSELAMYLDTEADDPVWGVRGFMRVIMLDIG